MPYCCFIFPKCSFKKKLFSKRPASLTTSLVYFLFPYFCPSHFLFLTDIFRILWIYLQKSLLLRCSETVPHLEEIQEPERNSRLIWLTWQRGRLPWKWSSQLEQMATVSFMWYIKKNQCPRKFFLPQWTQRTQKKRVQVALGSINTLQKIKLFTKYKLDVTFQILSYFRKPKMSV